MGETKKTMNKTLTATLTHTHNHPSHHRKTRTPLTQDAPLATHTVTKRQPLEKFGSARTHLERHRRRALTKVLVDNRSRQVENRQAHEELYIPNSMSIANCLCETGVIKRLCASRNTNGVLVRILTLERNQTTSTILGTSAPLTACRILDLQSLQLLRLSMFMGYQPTGTGKTPWKLDCLTLRRTFKY